MPGALRPFVDTLSRGAARRSAPAPLTRPAADPKRTKQKSPPLAGRASLS